MKTKNILVMKQRAFTMLELLVVMVILVLLAGVVTMLVVKRVEEARQAKAVADVKALGDALDQYSLHIGNYPTADEGLAALRERPQSDEANNWKGPYIKKSVPLDPWGADYIYVCPGQHNTDFFDLYSLGKDGKEGGTGNDADITNWE